jgi:hypothetical protein
LVEGQDRLVATKGEVALSLTALYKALGGGWELRGDDPSEERVHRVVDDEEPRTAPETGDATIGPHTPGVRRRW